jgi:hypothetical protein
MPELSLYRLFTDKLNRLGVRYMVTGSVAAMVYGEPRLTNDVDLVVFVGREDIPRLADAFPASEFYFPPAEVIGVELARERGGHFNIIHHKSGHKADVYLGGSDPFHAWALARARRLESEGETLIVAPAEYVIVRKLEYFRDGGSEKHLRDIRSILTASPEWLDLSILEEQITARGLQSAWQRVQQSE